MDINRFWPLAERAVRTLGDQYEPLILEFAAKNGLNTTVIFNCLLVAKIFEPDPITVERFRVRAPYASPKLYAERLANAAAGGFLRPVEQTGYVLTEKGTKAVTATYDFIYGCLSRWRPLADEKLACLAELLRRLVEASLAASEPPGHWCLAHSRKLDPGLHAPLMVRIDQYLSDLAAYRDDAHLASWQNAGVDGPSWDALTCLWRQSPLTLEDIFTGVKRRGWDKSDYAVCLEDLVRKGWVEQKGERYSILPSGREVRQAAEILTDEYFYRPWKCLSDNELEEFEVLLNQVCASLK